MKAKIELEVNICEACGKIFLYQPMTYLKGGSCEYEPILFGKYCKGCYSIAQNDWNRNGRMSRTHQERFDRYTKTDHLNEIININIIRMSLGERYLSDDVDNNRYVRDELEKFKKSLGGELFDRHAI